MFVDDAIFSLVKFLQTDAQFVCKDLTGAAETRTGTLSTLFPDFNPNPPAFVPHVYPARLYNLEEMPTPAVAVAVEIDPVPQGHMIGCQIYRHTGRFFCVGTHEVRNGDGTVSYGKDYDATVLQTLQLQNALTLRFRGQPDGGEPRDTLVPWYRATYSASAVPVRVGDMKILAFRVHPVDDNRFACGFMIETME